MARKHAWARTHPKPVPSAEERKEAYAQTHSATVARGRVRSAAERSSGSWLAGAGEPELLWIVRLAVPFDWAMSKNHLWARRRTGHVYLREESRAAHVAMVLRFREALRDQPVVQAKLWVDVLVQKPDHRGDAVNFLDFVCDALKEATGLDDRWFSVRRLDWEIVKDDPVLYVGIGQDVTDHQQVCSYCGRILPAAMFWKNARLPYGIGRECKECRTGRRD